MSKKTIKLKESDIQRIVENILSNTNEMSGEDLSGLNDPGDDGSSCSAKYTIGKDEEGHHYIIDLTNNQIIAMK